MTKQQEKTAHSAMSRDERSSTTDEIEIAARKASKDWIEKVVSINRCAKVVRGGRRFSFSALVVCGNQNSSFGIGLGKANEVAEAIRKATDAAYKRTFVVALRESTIPHRIVGHADGGRVVLIPACPGTGVVAGGAVRPLLEVVGIKNILSKSLGSNNPFSMLRAAMDALLHLRTKEQIFALRRELNSV
jgi:small subunit ribosomal protein S5